jgi:5'(3')-deoxyribonucleotidase
MNRRPRILLDVDGPLTPGFFLWCCSLLRQHGVDAHPDKIDQWDIMRSFKVSKEIEEDVRSKLRRPGIASAFQPYPGALAFVEEVREWADVYAVTAPLDGSETWAHERERWLAESLRFAPSQVISARDKRLVAGDAFVDDKLTHLIDWSAEYPNGRAIMWDEPHNRSDVWEGLRAFDYEDLRDCLEPLRRAAAGIRPIALLPGSLPGSVPGAER